MDTWPTGGSSLVALDAICATLDGPHPEARLIIQCEKNATGRYLVIQITGSRSILSLCEVEVFVRGRFEQHKCRVELMGSLGTTRGAIICFSGVCCVYCDFKLSHRFFACLSPFCFTDKTVPTSVAI